MGYGIFYTWKTNMTSSWLLISWLFILYINSFVVKIAISINRHNTTSPNADDGLLLQKLIGLKQALSMLANYYSEVALKFNCFPNKVKVFKYWVIIFHCAIKWRAHQNYVIQNIQKTMAPIHSFPFNRKAHPILATLKVYSAKVLMWLLMHFWNLIVILSLERV